MGLKHVVHQTLSRIVAKLGATFHAKSLPCYFNRKWVRLNPQSWAALRQNYEPYVALALEGNLREGGIFVDVGSHLGIWSVYAARIVGKTGKVFAFEPSPAYAVLKENAAMNSPVEPFNIGLGARDGEATFFDQGTASSGSFVDAVTRINQPFQADVSITGKKVKIRSLDSLLTEFKVRPDLIKIDVEGFEFEVIRGAENLIRHVRPPMLIEIHPPQLKLSGGSDKALLSTLEGKGYAIEVLDHNPNSLYTILARPRADGDASLIPRHSC